VSRLRRTGRSELEKKARPSERKGDLNKRLALQRKRPSRRKRRSIEVILPQDCWKNPENEQRSEKKKKKKRLEPRGAHSVRRQKNRRRKIERCSGGLRQGRCIRAKEKRNLAEGAHRDVTDRQTMALT